jgi:hypothetical protein
MTGIGRFSLAMFIGLAWLVAAPLVAGADELKDLKAQVQALMQRIEALETQVQEQASVEANAPAKMVSSGNDGVNLAVSGQVNRALLLADDGDRSRIFHVDNDNSSTRVRWVGTGPIDDDFTAGAIVEVEFESNTSSAIDIDQDGEVGANNFSQRHMTVYLDSKSLGRLWLGQGDTASNGTSEVDLSGTSVINYAGIEDLAGGLSFKNAATAAKLVTIGGVYSQMDGFSRRDRIRYDTPKFYGFQASTSLIQGDAWDVALRYSANYEAIDTKVAAAIAYGDGAQRFDLDQFNGSVSLLHGSGLNLTFASGEQDLTGGTAFTRDPSFYYGKLGYQFDPFTIGTTALAVDYGVADDLAATGDEFTSWGLFAVQGIDKIATDLYFGFRNHDLERTGVVVDDINVAVMGARVKF